MGQKTQPRARHVCRTVTSDRRCQLEMKKAIRRKRVAATCLELPGCEDRVGSEFRVANFRTPFSSSREHAMLSNPASTSASRISVYSEFFSSSFGVSGLGLRGMIRRRAEVRSFRHLQTWGLEIRVVGFKVACQPPAPARGICTWGSS